VQVEAAGSPSAPWRPKTLGVHQVPGLRSGERPASAWAFAPPASGELVLGPGRLEFDSDRVFEPGQPVRIEPGTQLALAGGVSLVFSGPLDIRGSAQQPVRIEGLGAKPFGGIVLQGPATAGSGLRHLIVRGGSTPRYRAGQFPGTISIHDTSRIRIEQLRLEANLRADDFLHVAYVAGLEVDGLTVVSAAGDAIDLEFVSGRLRDVRVAGAGDEALDLMGSDLELIDSILDRAGGNAVSAGERSLIRIRGSLLARSGTGLVAKHGSRIELSDSLLVGNQIGVRLGRPGRYYPEASRLSAGVLTLVGCQTDLEVDPRDAANLVAERISHDLPSDGALGHLRRDVLRAGDWAGLEARLDALAGEAPP
jgi:hypothetical protein